MKRLLNGEIISRKISNQRFQGGLGGFKMIKRYNEFILESFDEHIKKELKRMGIEKEQDIVNYVHQAHRGSLAEYLKREGRKFTFGLLHAIFLDAQAAKRKTDFRVGVAKMVHRLAPIALAPFYPIMAIVGYILGTSRAFNKVIAPILADPGRSFPDFLQRIVLETMKIAEGEIIPTKDRFTRAFVVDGSLTDMIKEEVLFSFALYLSNRMVKENPDSEVPDFYVENELRKYLNRKFDINPPLQMKSI